MGLCPNPSYCVEIHPVGGVVLHVITMVVGGGGVAAGGVVVIVTWIHCQNRVRGRRTGSNNSKVDVEENGNNTHSD